MSAPTSSGGSHPLLDRLAVQERVETRCPHCRCLIGESRRRWYDRLVKSARRAANLAAGLTASGRQRQRPHMKRSKPISDEELDRRALAVERRHA